MDFHLYFISYHVTAGHLRTSLSLSLWLVDKNNSFYEIILGDMFPVPQ